MRIIFLTEATNSFTYSINSIISGLSLLVTILSVICAFLAYGHQRKRSKKGTACDLSKVYADSIISRYAYIRSVFQHTGLEEKIKKWFPMQNISNFNQLEMQRLLGNASLQYEDVKKEFTKLDAEKIVLSKILLYATKSDRSSVLTMYNSFDDKVKPDVIRIDFENEISMLLNDLEWFAMNCKYRIADEKLLFQSLHQTYLSMVWLLYYYIASTNCGQPEDKYYTNVIWLFKTWKEKVDKLASKNQKKAKRVKKLENKVNQMKEEEITSSGTSV